MNKVTKIFLPAALCILVMALFFMGSSRKILSRSEFIEWVEKEDNGLKKENDFDQLTYTARYLPTNYVILKDDAEFNFNDPKSKPIISGYNKSVFFDLEIRSKTQNDPLHTFSRSAMEYNDLLKYYSFDAQNDLSIIQGLDTLPCKLYHLERSYNTTPYMRMSLVFERPEKFSKDDFILSFNEKKLGSGRVSFYYAKAEIAEIPELK